MVSADARTTHVVRACPRGWGIASGEEFEVRETYEIRSGRKVVTVQVASSPQEALLGYLRACGSRDADIVRLGATKAAWHGAVFSVAPVPETEPVG